MGCICSDRIPNLGLIRQILVDFARANDLILHEGRDDFPDWQLGRAGDATSAILLFPREYPDGGCIAIVPRNRFWPDGLAERCSGRVPFFAPNKLTKALKSAMLNLSW